MHAPALAYRLNPGEPYNQIYVKVANEGDNSIITAIRLGSKTTTAFYHEWKQMGMWQPPIHMNPGECIVGLRGYFGGNDSIKSLGFILMKPPM